MKRFLALLAIIVLALFITNCRKSSDSGLSNLADVQFSINSVTQNGGLKSTQVDSVVCNDTLTADYVKYKMDGGGWKTIPVFYVGNIPWTNTIKLSPGQHILNEFLVYSNHHTPNDSTDDVLLMATPHTGSPWAGYVTTPLNWSFNVVTDEKTQVKMDVVCFKPSVFLDFGFVYFQLNELIIRQLWFFGDFCIKDASQYAGSDYVHQPNWVTTGYIDAPAIFRIDVWRNGVQQQSFTNDDAAHHYGDKVSVTYGDYVLQTDVFILKLYILVRQGTAFNFMYFYSWTFNDISNIPKGSDGVTDFILGSCYDPSNPPELILPPYMNLPPTATYTITGNYAPGSLGGYVDATLTNVPAGYMFGNGTYASWCSDHQTTINVGQAYNMYVYSSLYPSLLPTYAQLQSGKWSKINWVFNHKDWYPNLKWYELQQLVWLYDDIAWYPPGAADGGVPAINDPNYPTRALQMYSDANTYGINYVPSPGGWAAVIFILDPPPQEGPFVQTMFIQIDP